MRIIRTPMHVEQNTLMHAVVETEDGHLLSSKRFVEAVGDARLPVALMRSKT